MKRNVTHGLVCRAGLAVIIVCNLAGSALAQTADTEAHEPDVESAESQAARAYQAYVAGDYASAIRLYLAAYQAASDPDILYNIARIYESGLRDRAKAAQFYLDFIANPNADPKRVELASVRLRALRSAAQAEPSQAPSPAAPPSLADRAAPSAAVAPPTVPPPPASADGGALIAAPRSRANAWSPLRTGALVTGSAGLVALGVGAVFGIKALSEAQTARQDCDGNRCTTERGVSAARSAGQAADVATLSFAAGGLLIATGATLLGLDLGASASAGSEDPAPPALSRWTAAVTTADVRFGFRGCW